MNGSPAKRTPDTFVFVLLMVLVFLLAARTPLDADMWWHLAAGQQTWLSGQPMVLDVFSFTQAGATWINHSWLSQVLLYLIFSGEGYLGLGVAVAGLATASMGLTYAQMRGPAIFRAFLVILGCTVAAVVWSPRPQLASLVLFAGLGWILYGYKWKAVNRLWLLPLLFCLWSNLHGGWALGYLLLGAMLAGEVLNHLLRNPNPEVLTWRRIILLAGWGILSVPFLAIHPNGLNILSIPFQTVEVQALQSFIQEWASPNFHELFQQPYLWLLLAVLAAFGLSGRRVDGSDLITVCLFATMGFIARRNFGPFALAALPILSRYGWAALRAWRNPEFSQLAGWGPGVEEPERFRRRPAWMKVLNGAMVAFFGLLAFGKVALVTLPGVVDEANAQGNPVVAANWLREQPAGRIFNEYNWGGYLIWSLPQDRVFVDGRTDLYGDKTIGEWMQIIQAGEGWQVSLQSWQVDYVLIDPNRPLAQVLAQSGWVQVKADPFASLWKKSGVP